MRTTFPRRKRNRAERTLLTIHGIRTDGPWQERFEEIFDPHFHYESFKYPEFEHSILAIFFLALEWFALLFALACLVWAWITGWLGAGLIPCACACLFVASILWTANLIADHRRDQVVTNFINFVDKSNGFGLPPHVVAHSLGSFVLCRMLFRYPELKIGKIVLLGCVLQPELDWSKIRQRFQIVRNELGSKDWVSSLARVLRPFIGEMGHAGKAGFRKPEGSVLNLSQEKAGAAWKHCDCDPCHCNICSPTPDVAVMNIEGQGIGHNDLSAITVRARRRWLPFFWDIPPAQYESFVQLCNECDEMEANGNENLQQKIDDLLAGCWYWSNGPLEPFLRRQLEKKHVGDPANHIRQFATNLFRAIAEADRAADKPLQKFLFPLRAVAFSLERTLKGGA